MARAAVQLDADGGQVWEPNISATGFNERNEDNRTIAPVATAVPSLKSCRSCWRALASRGTGSENHSAWRARGEACLLSEVCELS